MKSTGQMVFWGFPPSVTRDKLWDTKAKGGNSLAVQWLGLRAFTAKGLVSILGWGTRIPASHVARPKKKTHNNKTQKTQRETKLQSIFRGNKCDPDYINI